jgi:hypothetical protein
MTATREDEMAALVTVLALLALLGLALSVRIVKQYEKGVLFRLGRVIDVREPDLTLISPPRASRWPPPAPRPPAAPVVPATETGSNSNGAPATHRD